MTTSSISKAMINAKNTMVRQLEIKQRKYTKFNSKHVT